MQRWACLRMSMMIQSLRPSLLRLQQNDLTQQRSTARAPSNQRLIPNFLHTQNTRKQYVQNTRKQYFMRSRLNRVTTVCNLISRYDKVAG